MGVGRARSKTMYKSYVCDVSSTILSSFLAPQRGFWINCNTTRPRNSEVKALIVRRTCA